MGEGDVLYAADSRLKEAGAAGVEQRSAIYGDLLQAVRSVKEAAALQLGGTLIKAHAAAFPSLLGESAASLISLCTHDELKVRSPSFTSAMMHVAHALHWPHSCIGHIQSHYRRRFG